MEEKKRTTPLRRHFPLAFLFPLQKNVCIYTHIKRGDTCVHTWWMKKKGQKGRKGGCSSRTLRGVEDPAKKKKNQDVILFLLCFLLFFALLFFALFCLSFGFKKNGKEEGEKRRTATTTAALQDIRERWRKGNLKRGWRGGDCLFMEKKEN